MSDDREPSSRTPATRNQVVALVAVVALLIVSSVAALPVAAAGSALLDLDEHTPLSERETWDTFEKEGVATADVAAPDLEITVAKEHDDLGVDGFHNDYANEWIRVTYGEDIDRTIRFYVPSNYWKPYYDESVEPVDAPGPTAKFVPVEGGRYMAVTIKLDGPTSVVFPVSQMRGSTWSFWSEQDQKLENTTGVSSGIDGTDQWNYADGADWSNGTLVIEDVENPDRVAIQYDADVSADKEVWLAVPEGEGRAPAYYFVREPSSDAGDENATIVVVSKKDDEPPVRLKKGATRGDGVGSILNDWKQIPTRVGGWLDSVFGNGKK